MGRYPLTNSQFAAFDSQNGWAITEVSYAGISHLPNIPRQPNVIAIFTSGDMNSTKLLHGIESVLGADVLVHEPNPDTAKNEPALNIYHCVIQKLRQPVGEFCYLMHGPFEGGTLFGHWKDESVIEKYEKLLSRPTHPQPLNQGGV